MSDIHTYSLQCLDDEDIDAVLSVLKSPFLTQGPKIEEFERAVCAMVNAKFACAVTNATAGLHLAMNAMGISAGDRVWTTPNTFVATVNTAIQCGASVELIDISEDSLNINLDLIETRLAKITSKQRLPKLIVPVHFGGVPCDMPRLHSLAEKYGFSILEDASHALGSFQLYDQIGCSKYSDATVFSFHPVKPITSGEGGVIVTNNNDFSADLMRMRTHGIARCNQGPNKGFMIPSYDQISDGFNYRLSEIHATLGLSQLRHVFKYAEKRALLRQRYESNLKEYQVRFQDTGLNNRSTHHLLVLRFINQYVRDAVATVLSEANVGINFHYSPIYRHTRHKNLGIPTDFPVMENYFATGLTVPLHVNLTINDVDNISSYIIQVLNDHE